MNIKELIAECTAYDFKEMLEEKRPKSPTQKYYLTEMGKALLNNK